jgi:hypothetical protein
MPRGAGAKGVDGGKGDEGEERGEDMGLETVTWGTGERRAPPIRASSVQPRSRASGGARGNGSGEWGGDRARLVGGGGRSGARRGVAHVARGVAGAG